MGQAISGHRPAEQPPHKPSPTDTNHEQIVVAVGVRGQRRPGITVADDDEDLDIDGDATHRRRERPEDLILGLTQRLTRRQGHA